MSEETEHCKHCGEAGRCVSIVNPVTGQTEYWVKPERMGRCKGYQNGGGLDGVCDTGTKATKEKAIKSWNSTFAKTIHHYHE